MDQAATGKDGANQPLARQRPDGGAWFSSPTTRLRMGAGFAAMALFTAAALLYTSVTLYLINKATRQRIAGTDIPVITTLIKLRTSLLAQENFAGKYAIFKDPAFVQLFRQRNDDALADLQVLEATRSIPTISSLKRLYRDYQAASERLFASNASGGEKRQASALLLVSALDELYIERQGALQAVLDRAERLQRSTIRRGIGISCAGFLLAVLLARVTIFRVIHALKRLQHDIRRLAAGDLNYHPLVSEVRELGELAGEVNQIAARLIEMEQAALDAHPVTRLPGNQAIERVLDQRLQEGAPFSFCLLHMDHFPPFLARYGYARAGQLLFETGVLVHRAVRRVGEPEGFAGHAGGDSFVMVLAPEQEAVACRAVIEEFEAQVGKLLDPADREAAAITWQDRGGPRQSPLPGLCVTVLGCDKGSYSSAVEIARAAVEARQAQGGAPGCLDSGVGPTGGTLP